jgi:phage baseplate assembly protein gpV
VKPNARCCLVVVTRARAKDCKVRVNIPDLKVETDWLPVLQLWTHGARAFHLPREGQQGCAVFLDDDFKDGFFLGGRYGDKDPPPGAEIGPDDLYFCLEDGGHIRLAPGLIDMYTPGAAGEDRAAVQVLVGGSVWVESDMGVGVCGKAGVVVTTGGELQVTADMKIDVTAQAPVTIGGTAITLRAPTIVLDAQAVTIKAPAVTLDAASVNVSGALAVDGPITAASLTASGAVKALTVGTKADVTALEGTKTLLTHLHKSSAPGVETTPPV